MDQEWVSAADFGPGICRLLFDTHTFASFAAFCSIPPRFFVVFFVGFCSKVDFVLFKMQDE